MTVRLDWRGLQRAMTDRGWGDTRWELLVDDGPPGRWAVVTEVIGEVNAIYNPPGSPGGPVSEDPIETTRGTVAYFMPVGEDEELRGWFEELVRRLGDRGFSGLAGPARPDPSPAWFTAAVERRDLVLSAVLGLELRDGPPSSALEWGVGEHATTALLDVVVPWLAEDAGRLLLVQEAYVEELPGSEDLTALLLRAAERGVAASVVRLGEENQARVVSLTRLGVVTVQLAGAPGQWASHVAQLLEVVRGLGQWTDLGLVRRLPLLAQGWADGGGLPPPSPFATVRRPSGAEHLIQRRASLRSTHVVDVHGVQVLTDAHLLRLPGLPAERWEVVPLGAGRQLVAARAPGAWYAAEVPQQAALEQGRLDFGPVLLDPADQG